MAEKARDQGIQIFSVAASKEIDEFGMREIANSPYELFRDDYIAVEIVDGKPRLSTKTIDRIVKAMVSWRLLALKCCVRWLSLTAVFFLFFLQKYQAYLQVRRLLIMLSST